MTIFYSKFGSLFETLRCTPSKCQSLKSPLWSAVLLPLWVHLLPLCSLLTPLQPQEHFLHVPGIWLACFHLSPLLAIPLVWYWHIFLSFFLQIFALRSPIKEVFLTTYSSCLLLPIKLPQNVVTSSNILYSSQFCGWGVWAGLGWKPLLELISIEVIQCYLVGEWAWREASLTCLALWKWWWKAGLNLGVFFCV